VSSALIFENISNCRQVSMMDSGSATLTDEVTYMYVSVSIAYPQLSLYSDNHIHMPIQDRIVDVYVHEQLFI
jgi:hypothetical protein